MRLESSSPGGLAVGDADSRYFRLAAANTATKYQQFYSDGADGHTWPSVDVMHIWNDAGNNWTAFKVNVTNTASGSASKLADFQVGGASLAFIEKSGRIVSKAGNYNDAGMLLGASGAGFSTYYGGAMVVSYDGNYGPVFFPYNGSNGGIGLCAENILYWTVSYDPNISQKDTGLERDAAGVVKFTNASGSLRDWKARRGSLSEYLDITEMSAPAAPAANTARLYVEDNGSGKTRLMVLFPTGAAQVLATEP